MNKEQVLEQLRDLKASQYTFITSDKELSAIFEKDVEALDYAIKDMQILDSIRDYCEIAFRDSEENEDCPITRKDLEHIYKMIEKRVSKYE